MKVIFLDIDETCVHSVSSKQYDKAIKDQDSSAIPSYLRKQMIEFHEKYGDQILRLDVDNGYYVLPRPGLQEFLQRNSDADIYVLSSAARKGYLEKIIPHFNIPAKEIFCTREKTDFGFFGERAGVFSKKNNQFLTNNWCLIDDLKPFERSLGIKFHTIGVPISKYNTSGFNDEDYQWCPIDPWYGVNDTGLNFKSRIFNATVNMYLTTDD